MDFNIRDSDRLENASKLKASPLASRCTNLELAGNIVALDLL